MREMQAGGIKRRRTGGGKRGVKEEGADEIIKQDGGIYSVGFTAQISKGNKHFQTHTPHAQADLLW